MRPDAIEIPRSDLSGTTDERATPSSAATALGRFAGAGRRLLRALSGCRSDVSELSEAQLRDIGLWRIEVELPSSAMSSIVKRSP
jgi:hypothetical protein